MCSDLTISQYLKTDISKLAYTNLKIIKVFL